MAQLDPNSRFSAGFPSTLVKPPAVLSSKKLLGLCWEWIDGSDNMVLIFSKKPSTTKHQGFEVIDIKIPFLPEGQKAHVLTNF